VKWEIDVLPESKNGVNFRLNAGGKGKTQGLKTRIFFSILPCRMKNTNDDIHFVK